MSSVHAFEQLLTKNNIGGFYYLRGLLEDHTSPQTREEIYQAAYELYSKTCEGLEERAGIPVFAFKALPEENVVLRLCILRGNASDTIDHPFCYLDLTTQTYTPQGSNFGWEVLTLVKTKEKHPEQLELV